MKCKYIATALLWLASFYYSIFKVRSSKEVRSKRFFLMCLIYRPFPFFLGGGSIFVIYWYMLQLHISCNFQIRFSSHVSSVLSSKYKFLFQTFVYPWGVSYENYPPYKKYYNFTSSTAPDLNPACNLNMCDLFLLYTAVEDNISVQEL
jgi:hypothetical protein